ncbi:MAG: hypothetical protein Q8P22_05815 [Chloroflexota bacterium]|nr:hypothetical protein [Chloroflexota bacterium]
MGGIVRVKAGGPRGQAEGRQTEMLAHFGLPGESKFAWRHGNRTECAIWLEATLAKARDQGFPQGIPTTGYLTDREARKVRYRDGNRVYDWESRGLGGPWGDEDQEEA